MVWYGNVGNEIFKWDITNNTIEIEEWNSPRYKLKHCVALKIAYARKGKNWENQCRYWNSKNILSQMKHHFRSQQKYHCFVASKTPFTRRYKNVPPHWDILTQESRVLWIRLVLGGDTVKNSYVFAKKLVKNGGFLPWSVVKNL